MSWIGIAARTYWIEVGLVLLGVDAVVEVSIGRDSPFAPQASLWFVVLAVVLLVLPLFAHRRNAFVAGTGYWLVATAISFIDGSLVPFASSLFVLGMAASVMLGRLRNLLQSWTGLAVVVGGGVVIVLNKPERTFDELIFVTLTSLLCWLAGSAVRVRAEQAEAAEERAGHAARERDAAARIAVAEERARIARELHDIVAHAVSVMVLQVGAVRHGLPEARQDDREALCHVERAGRTALSEMRRLLGAMRTENDVVELSPQPGLSGLESLRADVGHAGLPVELHVDGDVVPLSRAIDLSVYRIVQEGLTNALKHSKASRAEVTLRYRPRLLEVEILDDGNGAATTDGLGHGLVGIRERVKLYGGEMSAGNAPTGGFILTARLPIENYEP